MVWIIMIKAQSTHELVLGYTRPNRSTRCNRSNRSRHPVNERQLGVFCPETGCAAITLKWAVRGLVKLFEDAASYITMTPFKIYDLHDNSKQNERPTMLTCLAIRQYWDALQNMNDERRRSLQTFTPSRKFKTTVLKSHPMYSASDEGLYAKLHTTAFYYLVKRKHPNQATTQRP